MSKRSFELRPGRLALRTALRWPPSRHLLGAAGLGLAAIGLAHRLAFTVTLMGAVLLVAGIALLALALLAWPPTPGSDFEGNLAMTGLFLLAAGLSAARLEGPGLAVNALVLAAAVAFMVLEVPPTRQARLWVVLAIILAAHVTLMLQLPYPKQDVFRQLTNVVDALFHHARDPYGLIYDPVSPDVLPSTLGYPPGAFLAVAPFRLLLGDVRWAYIAGEVAFVVAGAAVARREDGLPTWRQALLLTPLVLPGTSLAYFDYGNHEWVLLGLAAGALALRRRPVLCGILLGLGIVAKQHFIVFPVLFLLPWLPRRALAWAAVTAVALFVPFLAWDPGGTVRAVLFQLFQPLDADRLSLYGILRALGLDPGSGVALGMSLLGLLVALACARVARQGPRDLGRALVACGVGMALFSFLAKSAAYNYYGYALALVAWGLAVSGPGQGEEARGATGVVGIPREIAA